MGIKQASARKLHYAVPFENPCMGTNLYHNKWVLFNIDSALATKQSFIMYSHYIT